MIEPVDPFERGEFHRLCGAPGAAPVDDLGLEQAVDGFGEGVVVAVADAPHRGLDPRRGQALGIADRDVLNAADALLFVKPEPGPGLSRVGAG